MSVESYKALTKVPDRDAPLVFAFHGTGGDEHQFFDLAQELVPGAGVISPRGDVSEMGAARFFRRTGEGVYDMNDLARATAKMARFVEAWKERYPDRPVHGFGYSNGANILASVMMARPDLFDRVAAEAGIDQTLPAAMSTLIRRGIESGLADEDYSALYEVVNPRLD